MRKFTQEEFHKLWVKKDMKKKKMQLHPSEFFIGLLSWAVVIGLWGCWIIKDVSSDQPLQGLSTFGMFGVIIPVMIMCNRQLEYDEHDEKSKVHNMIAGSFIGVLLGISGAFGLYYNAALSVWFYLAMLVFMEIIFWIIKPSKTYYHLNERIGHAIIDKIVIYISLVAGTFVVLGSVKCIETITGFIKANMAKCLEVLEIFGIIIVSIAALIGFFWLNSLKYRPKQSKKQKR